MLKTLAIIAFTFFFFNSFSQNVEFVKENFEDDLKGFDKAFVSFNQGIEYFDQAIFNKALDYFLEANTFNPHNAELNFLIGICYLNTIYKDKALKFLKKSYKLDEEYSYKINFLLGRAYQFNYDFKDAKTEYYKFLLYLPKDSLVLWQEIVDKKILECNNGIELMMQPSDGLITELKDINSEAADYAPVISGDGKTIYFTSRREGSSKSEIDLKDNQPYEDVYYSTKIGYKWQPPQGIGNLINTKSHDATVSISSDGTELYIYRGQINGGDIFVSKKEGATWGKPEALPKSINTEWQENSASISKDNKLLYFVSDKEGGVGGKDIYVAKRDDENNWVDIKPLEGSINTKYDEDGVFITASQNVLYFSSTGHKTMGGYDIFYSTKKPDGSWAEPINMGYPINSPDDDIFFFVTDDEKQGFYTSVRKGGEGGRDNYTIRFSETIEDYLAAEKVFDCENECVQSLCVALDVTFFEDKKAESLKYEWLLGDGSIRYGSRINYCYEKPGKYQVVLNVISEEGFRSENIKTKEVIIEGNQVGRAIISSPDYALIDTKVAFDGGNSFYINGVVSDYLWEFNNGETDDSVVTFQSFDTAGTYNVKLSILAITNQNEDSCCYTNARKTLKVFKNKKELQEYLNGQKDDLDFDEKFKTNIVGLYNFTAIVIDSTTGLPIAEAEIILKADNDSVEYVELTNTNGQSNFILDNSKEYGIEIFAEGYQKASFLHSLDGKTENEFSRDTFRLNKEKNLLPYAELPNQNTSDSIPILESKIKDFDLKPIYFEFDRWDIVAEAAMELDKMVEIMTENPSMLVELSSHTDCQGDANYNMILSKRRSKASLNYILSKNIDATRISEKWYGESRPNVICDCEKTSTNRCTRADNKLNRRTEFKILRFNK